MEDPLKNLVGTGSPPRMARSAGRVRPQGGPGSRNPPAQLCLHTSPGVACPPLVLTPPSLVASPVPEHGGLLPPCFSSGLCGFHPVLCSDYLSFSGPLGPAETSWAGSSIEVRFKTPQAERERAGSGPPPARRSGRPQEPRSDAPSGRISGRAAKSRKKAHGRLLSAVHVTSGALQAPLR